MRKRREEGRHAGSALHETFDGASTGWANRGAEVTSRTWIGAGAAVGAGKLARFDEAALSPLVTACAPLVDFTVGSVITLRSAPMIFRIGGREGAGGTTASLREVAMAAAEGSFTWLTPAGGNFRAAPCRGARAGCALLGGFPAEDRAGVLRLG